MVFDVVVCLTMEIKVTVAAHPALDLYGTRKLHVDKELLVSGPVVVDLKPTQRPGGSRSCVDVVEARQEIAPMDIRAQHAMRLYNGLPKLTAVVW
jgi:hypothetical protein